MDCVRVRMEKEEELEEVADSDSALDTTSRDRAGEDEVGGMSD